MQLFLSNLIQLSKRLLFILGLYVFCRIYFIAFHFEIFLPFNLAEFILVLANGLKFDLSALLLTNALFILLHLIPLPFSANRRYQIWLKTAMVTVNGLLLSLNIIDTGYFSFQNSRSSADFAKNMLFSSDTITILPHYLLGYWYHSLCTVLIFATLWILLPRHKKISYNPNLSKLVSSTIIAGISILVIGLSITGIRGTKTKPLRIVDAVVNTSSKYAPAVLNTPFTVLKTIGKTAITPIRYFPEETAREIYSSHKKTATKALNDSTKKNIVLIIMESLSNEIIGELNGDMQTYTPFVDSLISQSLVFENMFSNGRTSIQAVPSILVSLPQLMDVSLITSQYAANNVNSLASVLHENDYTTSFFHGAFNGSMGFDKYCSAIGFEHYYGQDEYLKKNNDLHSVCSWGVFDDTFLSFTADELNKTEAPFFASIFTISSHHPYELPQQYAYFGQNTAPDLAAVRYADYSIKLFFDKIKHEPWYANTIFVLVADHTAPYSTSGGDGKAQNYGESSGFDLLKMRIPLILFDPSNDSLRGRSTRVVQQLDIMPSIFHLLQIDTEYISFGNDFFDTETPKFAFSYTQGIYTYIDSADVIQFDGVQILKATDRINNTDTPRDRLDRKTDFIKAYIQDYTHRMVYNRLH